MVRVVDIKEKTQMLFVPQAESTSPTEGEIYYDQTLRIIRSYNGTAWRYL